MELLVVIAIIGVLVALLLPAIQAAREAARRSQCSNNLKQLGLAVQMHHDAKKVYPPGRDAGRPGESPTGTKSVSWAYYCLPYMEQQAMFQAYRPTFDVFAPENSATFRTPVPTFFCPSRRAPAADRDFDNNDAATTVSAAAAGGDYAANAGDEHDLEPDDDDFDWAEAGPIFTQSKVNERHVTDGLSNTIAVGEKFVTELVPEGATPPEPGREHALRGDSAIFAGDSLQTVLRTGDHGFPLGTPDVMDNTRFGSEHTQQVHFVFLDGGVRLIPYTVDRQVLELLTVVADGNTIPAY